MTPEGPEGIEQIGHRRYVGGQFIHWDEGAEASLVFLKKQGLRSDHVFLDIGCGCLRVGRKIIEFLDIGKYYGIDKEEELLRIGLEKELTDTQRAKIPLLIIDGEFKFGGLGQSPDISFSLSLFTHLEKSDIKLCLKNLYQSVNVGHRYFSTFVVGLSSQNIPPSHSHKAFRYSEDEMKQFGEEAGWKTVYHGDWGYPIPTMVMMEFQKNAIVQ